MELRNPAFRFESPGLIDAFVAVSVSVLFALSLPTFAQPEGARQQKAKKKKMKSLQFILKSSR